MAFLQAGLRESRKTRSRSPYPPPLVRDSHEGRYASLSDRPSPPMSVMEGQDHVQGKFSAPSVHSSVASDFLGSDSHSGVSSRSGSISVSEEAIHCGRGRLRAASTGNPRGPSSKFSDDWGIQDELESLQSRTRELEQTNQKLEVDKRILEAMNSTLQGAYSELLDRVNTPREKDTGETMVIELNRNDFPLVKCWVKKIFIQAEAATLPPGERGKGRASQGVNVAMRYVEDENGEPVDGYLAQYIRTWARGIWVEIAEKGILRAKWGDMSVEDLKYYHREMRRKFPILALCENSWKADQIAIDNYSSWHTSYAPKYASAKVKQESNVASGIFTDQISVGEACLESDVVEFPKEKPKEKPKLTFKIANTLNSPSLPILPSVTQPSVDPLAVTESVTPTEAPPITSETTATGIQLQLPNDSSMMPQINVDEPAMIEPMLPGVEVPAQPASSSIASCTVEMGLPTSAAVLSVLTTADASDVVTGVSPSSLPPLSLLAPVIALADGHTHPAVPPTTSSVLTDVTNDYATSASGQTQTASNSNDSAKRTLMRPSKVINGRNECAREWRGRNKGTTLEFNEYYTSLSAEIKQHWEKYAVDLRAQLGKNTR